MCTDFVVSTAKNYFVNGRSMESSLELNSQLFFRKAGYQFTGEKRPATAQHSWRGQYSFMGTNAFGRDIVTDGMNTAGLSGGAIWLNVCECSTQTPASSTITNFDFLQWVLSRFSNCNQVILALGKSAESHRPLDSFFEYRDLPEVKPEVSVASVSCQEVSESSMPSGYTPTRFPLHDSTGHSIVVELIQGKARVYNNPVHICSSSKDAPFYIANLTKSSDVFSVDTQVKMQFENAELSTKLDAETLGKPKGVAPPKQFVRTLFMAGLADNPTNNNEALNLSFHVLNTFDISVDPTDPLLSKKGVSKKGECKRDKPQWVVSKDLNNLIFAVRFHNSPQVYSIDLRNINWDAWDGEYHRPMSIDGLENAAGSVT